eukprot:s1461_g6.t1
MRALQVDRAGASPLVRVSLIFGLDVDPEFYDGWRTFHDLVFYLQRNAFIRDKWVSYCQSPPGTQTYGPFSKFWSLLALLDWTLLDSDRIALSEGPTLSLGLTELAVWRPLFEWYWRQYVAKRVSCRKDFHDLQGINYRASFAAMQHLDRPTSELLNCIKDGTFHTGAYKSKFDACCDATFGSTNV